MILIVEDDPQVARLIALVLQRHGRTCEIVADGQTALRRARELKPSLIFADLTIKGMGGEQLSPQSTTRPGSMSSTLSRKLKITSALAQRIRMTSRPVIKPVEVSAAA